MPEFHVWDFSPKMEVRLNDDYIEKIRSLKVEKEFCIKDKHAHMCHGWKKPHRREFTMKKKVQVIAFWEGAPYHKIAERLFAEREWHGPDRPVVPHLPFINIKQFLTVHRVTGFSLEEMERNVIEVRHHWAGHVRYGITFPVVANKDWAWLLGLWCSCGGLITRVRMTKGYPTEERSVRFRVDRRVFERKVKPILRRIGHVPKLSNVWYVNKGIQHKLDRNRRKGIGNKPKKVFVLTRPLREIMEKFGLPTECPSQREKRGGKISCRRFNLAIPSWVKGNRDNTHAFVEGFINGGQIGSSFREYGGHLVRTVEVRFCSVDKKQTAQFARFFGSYLTKIGVTGLVDKMPRTSSKLQWLRYNVFKNSSLNTLFEKFDIQKPGLRARLALQYFMNALLYETCKVLSCSEIVILGGLIEKPMTEQEITEEFRFRMETVTTALEKLEALDVARKDDGTWKVNPTGYRERLVRELWRKEMARRRFITKNNNKFFSRCDNCFNIIGRNYKGPCGCGGRYRPVSRYLVLGKLRNYHIMSTIRKVSNQTIPVIGE